METVPHGEATRQLAEHLAPVFESSPDGVYIWLDEEHWMCNQRFAEIFGYEGPGELNDTPGLLQRIVDEEDQVLFSWNYWNRVQPLAFPATFRFRGKTEGRIDVPRRDRHGPVELRRAHVRLSLRPARWGDSRARARC